MNIPLPETKGHLLFAIVSHRPEIDFRVMEAIDASIHPLAMQGWQTSRMLSIGNADLAGARNTLLAQAYVGPFTDMLFVDADVSWERGAIERLVSYPVDLVLGAYPKRTEGAGFFLQTLPGPQTFVDPVTNEPNEAGLLEIGAGPTGLMRISRRCMTRMIQAFPERAYNDPTVFGSKAWNLFEFTVVNGERMGEDFNFCRLFRSIGGRVWTDPHLMLHHHGTKTYSGVLDPYIKEWAKQNVK